MPLFDFECACGNVDVDVFQPINETKSQETCTKCGLMALKILAFPAVKPSMDAHFNAATNTFVNSERELKDTMKAQSELMSRRTGLAHNYVPVDRRDKEQCGATDEGLDSTGKARMAAGITEPKKYM